MLGYEMLGAGTEAVVMLHDWFCDTTSYEIIKPYLCPEFTYYFVDVRGYGKSKDIHGRFSVEEIYTDLMALMDHLGVKRFHLVTHSMTGLVAQYAAVMAPERLLSLVAVTPTPACGSSGMLENMAFFEGATQRDQVAARQIVSFMTGGRYQGQFLDYKVARWWQSSLASARLGYLHMFVKTDFSQKVAGCKTPLLVITGQSDVQGHCLQDMKNTIGTWFEKASFVDLPGAGHYPMQEVPPLFADTLESYHKTHKA